VHSQKPVRDVDLLVSRFSCPRLQPTPPDYSSPHHSASPEQWRRASVPHLVLLDPTRPVRRLIAPAWESISIRPKRTDFDIGKPVLRTHSNAASMYGVYLADKGWDSSDVLHCCSDLQGRRRFPTMSVATVATTKAITLVGWSPLLNHPFNHEICTVAPCTFPLQK
jgi:hypothetical protein